MAEGGERSARSDGRELLAKLASSMTGKGAAGESLPFARALLEAQTSRCGSPEEWLRAARATLDAWPEKLPKRPEHVPDVARCRDIFKHHRGLVSDTRGLRRFSAAVKEIETRCREEGVFVYSDRDGDLRACLPDLFKSIAHLVRNLRDFAKLCRAMPAIMRSLPCESESTPVGYTHDFDLRGVAARAKTAASLDEFLSGYR